MKLFNLLQLLFETLFKVILTTGFLYQKIIVGGFSINEDIIINVHLYNY